MDLRTVPVSPVATGEATGSRVKGLTYAVSVPRTVSRPRAEPAALAARAATRHIVVIGGIGELIAARECVKVGMHVTVLEASDAVGGAIRQTEIDGVVVDAGAESYATRGGRVRALLDELGLTDRIVAPAAGSAWLAGIPARCRAAAGRRHPRHPKQPVPRGRAPHHRLVGSLACLPRPRAPAPHDRPQPEPRQAGVFAHGRQGADRLVAPVTTGVYSASPEDVDVDIAAPGLNAALTRVGSPVGCCAGSA